MCGILKMKGDQLVHEFVNLCQAVFAEGLDTNQRSVENIRLGEKKEESSVKMMRAKQVLFTTPGLFRNYRSRANPSINCMLWEAACATTSIPDLFEPIVIGEMHIGETFASGELRWHTPTDELIKEAADLFKSRRICS
ncbi:hypothetical protein DL96DRAFT_1562493 [Flagelloscypha sp. PMI_526]|nr:hypothetical protein DL96DRAFT_1562493 [Flagelloscypha sp. PMI_526]